MLKATIFDIQRGSYVDGPGIRTTVFFKGCNLRCKWCHNPESQSPKKQVLFYKNKCTDCGKCKEVCPNSFEKCDFCGKCVVVCPNGARELCGREYTAEEVLNEILKDRIFYETSGGGVTFSGGECMLYIDFLEEILRLCKKNDIHTAVDTAGNVPWGYFERILPYSDLFLYDVKCYSEKLHKIGTGESNELILQNLLKLVEKRKEIIVRVPIISGFNADENELKSVAGFLRTINVKSIELLPYHALGEHKWEAAGLKLNKFGVPTQENMKIYKEIFYA